MIKKIWNRLIIKFLKKHFYFSFPSWRDLLQAGKTDGLSTDFLTAFFKIFNDYPLFGSIWNIFQFRYNLRVPSPLEKGWDEVNKNVFHEKIFNIISLNQIADSLQNFLNVFFTKVFRKICPHWKNWLITKIDKNIKMLL